MSEFKKGHKLGTSLVEDENGDLLVDSQNILNRWRNYFCQLLNVHGVNDVGQTEMQTAEPLVSERSCSKIEIAVEKLKRYKSPGGDHTHTHTHTHIDSIWNKENAFEYAVRKVQENEEL
jgi:hypothetical protein